jgi:hypothetical protein
MNALMKVSVWLLLATAAALAMPDIASAQVAPQGEPVRTAAASPAPQGRLSAELQRALETRPETATALLVPAVQKVRAAAASPSPRPRLVAPPRGGLGYICNSGNCACAGADDCVKMIAADGKCTDGTVGCNDYGCTCQEN